MTSCLKKKKKYVVLVFFFKAVKFFRVASRRGNWNKSHVEDLVLCSILTQSQDWKLLLKGFHRLSGRMEHGRWMEGSIQGEKCRQETYGVGGVKACCSVFIQWDQRTFPTLTPSILLCTLTGLPFILSTWCSGYSFCSHSSLVTCWIISAWDHLSLHLPTPHPQLDPVCSAGDMASCHPLSSTE